MMFSTKKDMHEWQRDWKRRYADRMKISAVGRNTEAQTRYFYRQVPGFKPRTVGVVFLHLACSGSGVVAHEMSHAAHYAVDIPGKPLTKDWDEKFAWMTGWLVAQYWRAWYRSHLGRDHS